MAVHPYFDLKGHEARGLLYGLMEVNKIQLQEDSSLPSIRKLIQEGKVKYDKYDPNEHWQSYREIVDQVKSKGVGYADCEDLAPAIAAEDQMKGIASKPVAYEPKEGLFHVVTAVPNSASRYGKSKFPAALGAPSVTGYTLEDPSAAAGMEVFGGVRGKPMEEAMERFGCSYGGKPGKPGKPGKLVEDNDGDDFADQVEEAREGQNIGQAIDEFLRRPAGLPEAFYDPMIPLGREGDDKNITRLVDEAFGCDDEDEDDEEDEDVFGGDEDEDDDEDDGDEDAEDEDAFDPEAFREEARRRTAGMQRTLESGEADIRRMNPEMASDLEQREARIRQERQRRRADAEAYGSVESEQEDLVARILGRVTPSRPVRSRPSPVVAPRERVHVRVQRRTRMHRAPVQPADFSSQRGPAASYGGCFGADPIDDAVREGLASFFEENL